jgi:hypothetical protein
MLTYAKKLVATTLISSTLVLGAAPMAGAEPVNQDGLVNVNIGDVTVLEDVNVAAAVDAVVQACDLDVGPLALAVLGQAVAVDQSGRSRTICTAEGGPVTITQN